MNINDLTVGQAKEIAKLFGQQNASAPALDNKMVGKYVIVRCGDAGVHAGTLESHIGRECILTGSRRLWYWKPLTGKWLNAVAKNGLHEDSKISESVSRIHLTENCEIILCTDSARDSIQKLESSSNE